MTAADVNRHIRGHWGIENKSHYVRNTVYREDNNQAWAAEGPHALASLRNLTWDYSASRTRTPSRKPQNGSAATGCGLSSL